MIVKYLIAGAIQGLIFALIAFAIKGYTRQILFGVLLIASLFYVYFAIRADEVGFWLIVELVGVLIYSAIGFLGLRRSLWWLVAGWALHPIWDVALHYFGSGRSFAPES